MYDISLYGHLTIDRIFEKFNKRNGLGSIANVWKALINESPELKLYICPTEIGSAIVYIDKDIGERYSKASLSNFIQKPEIKNSKINHILYLNELKKPSFIPLLEGINCADICVGKKVNYLLLKYIDYLFIADEDCDDYEELKKHTRGKVIVHSSNGSYWEGGSYDLPPSQILKNVNVLGAGDLFAANFMLGLLENYSFPKIIEEAHLKTTERLSNG